MYFPTILSIYISHCTWEVECRKMIKTLSNTWGTKGCLKCINQTVFFKHVKFLSLFFVFFMHHLCCCGDCTTQSSICQSPVTHQSVGVDVIFSLSCWQSLMCSRMAFFFSVQPWWILPLRLLVSNWEIWLVCYTISPRTELPVVLREAKVGVLIQVK